MEGYFPLEIYCELAKCNKQAAFHRRIREAIPSFKDEEGRWFYYFCDGETDPNIPEDFIPARQFCKENYLTMAMLRYRIQKNFISKDDIYKSPARFRTKNHCERLFIRKDAQCKCGRITRRHMESSRPNNGYLTFSEWSDREDVSRQWLYSKIYYHNNKHNIPYIVNNGHYYIPESYKKEDVYK